MGALRWMIPRPGERLLPVLAALLTALAFPPLHLLVPSFVGLVPLAVWVARLPEGKEGRQAAVRGTVLFALVYFGILLYWILVALIWFTKLAILAYIGAVLVLMTTSSAMGWALFRLHRDARLPIWLALPLAWTFGEWLRAHLPQQLAFPWLGLGSSLTGYPELVGVAELVGARGVTFWLALVNGLVAAVLLAGDGGPRRGRRLPLSAALLLVTVLPMGWGIWRAGTLETRNVGRVGIVQPNIPEHIKVDREESLDSTWTALDRLIPDLEPGRPRLVVMPEVTIQELPRARAWVRDRMGAYARYLETPILFGAYGYTLDEAGEATFYNSAFLMEPQGLAEYQYDKRFLVPIVERVPILNPSWFGSLDYFGGLGIGQGWPLARAGGEAYGVLICYESSYPEGARRFRLAGADVLVNITNDAWYGREPWYARTAALWQHPAHMVMRAIENRMGVVRAANTGISLYVDPVGRTYGEIGLFQEGARDEPVYTTDVVTLYTRTGDLAGNGAAAATLLLLGWLWWADRRRGNRDRVPQAT